MILSRATHVTRWLLGREKLGGFVRYMVCIYPSPNPPNFGPIDVCNAYVAVQVFTECHSVELFTASCDRLTHYMYTCSSR